ncbi:dynactin subunit 4 isoform X1 [Neocloeon triangulifer]|uniref:dynactin subunit 4 isoform X1 n=1 Tax=Neocloeon triangulifer TaxID=2078957 RepID=UPI00286FAEB4|nr:dynactin subunit 4 isoform X1 [Neocloeon triangulifer]
MAFLMYGDPKVKYLCSCGSLKPISRIYFCRHCMKVKCGFCVSHEVDLHYCSNCLENLPSTEARLKKNRCGYCFDCPSCQISLNTRAVSQTVPHPDDPTKTLTKKSYYLVCAFCRWSSREASIPDQSVATGGWPELKSPHAKRVADLVEHYQDISVQEKEEEEKKKKFQSRPAYFHYAEKYGLSAAVARKRLSNLPQRENKVHQSTVEPSKATEEVDQLPDEVFFEPIRLSQITTVKQRLACPEVQPIDVSNLHPIHKSLLVKRSLRCRDCEHNVSKPEFNPSSTKFKIQLSAFYHVPDIKFLTCEPVFIGKRSELIITICNPTQHQTSFKLHPFELALLSPKLSEDEEEAPPTLKLSLPDSARDAQFQINGTIKLPTTEFQLLPRDDTAEFDDSNKGPTFNDDPKVVVWRRGNKIALRMAVMPNQEAEGLLCVGFAMEYGYVNTMTTLEKKEPQKVKLRAHIVLHTGQIFKSSQ